MTELTTIDAAAIATTVVKMARNGRFGEMEQLFAPPLRTVVSAETVRDAWGAEISKRGPVSTIGEPVVEHAKEGLVRVSVLVTCEHGELMVIVAVDSKGVLYGLRLAAPE